MSFFEELKRRNVFRVGVAYAVAAWVLLQVADLVLEAISAPDWVLQAMMMMVALGFVAALIIAWAYEMTPEGIRRERDVDRDQSVTQETANKLNRITIGLVIAAVAIVVADRLVPEKGSDTVSIESSITEAAVEEVPSEPAQDKEATDEASVAVLPFVNMSSDPEQEFFSDGISEEILNVLARIPKLKVAARTSSFQFKGQNLDIADIGRQLRVNHILEGSVRKAGSQLRITAQLIETQSGFHLWSDTFDRKLEDVFAIQDEIASAIAGELRTRLIGDSLQASTPVDLQAYELYLKARGLVAKRQESSLLEGIEILKQTLEFAPEYAPAMGTLAKVYMVLPFFSQEIPAGDAREQARGWAEKTLEIEPGNLDALAALAVVYSEADSNPAAGLELMRKAVAENPGSVTANNFLGDLLFRIGDLEGALVHESRAMELDPLGPIHLTDLSSLYFQMGDYDKAEDLAERALELDSTFLHSSLNLIDVWFVRGQEDKLAGFLQNLKSNPDLAGLEFRELKMVLHIAKGEAVQARKILGDLVQDARNGNYQAVSAAYNALYMGDFDTAGEMLMLAYEQGDGTWAFPRFVRLPEQAPDSEPWQKFWSLPDLAELADLRRQNGMDPGLPAYGSAAREAQ